MIKFINREFDLKLVNKKDIFICAFGYEKRSLTIYYKMVEVLSPDHILVFVFDDYKNYNYISSEIDKVVDKSEIETKLVKYDSEIMIYNSIATFIRLKIQEDQELNVHIDYSSMPRRWYYKLPIQLRNMVGGINNIYFWYVVGKYPGDYEAYPSAGIDSFSVLGKPSLRVAAKRMHVIGLSYDAVRTSAMISILDPDSYITCNAYNKDNVEISKNVRLVNDRVISMASMEIILQIDDFSFMISKLCEVANEFLPLGDVIFVPDGPKPLIFAMSLVPLLIKKAGITCLHVSRNKEFYEAVNVQPTKVIFGFSI